MSVSLSTFTAWLKDSTAVRCVLVEVDVKLSGGSVVTRYLSNTGYVTSSTDTPANTNYSPVVSGGVKFTEGVSLDGSFSLSYGDVELNNTLGDLDTWLNDYWTNRRIKIFIGDKSWIRDDFYQIFDGVTTGVDTRKRDTINLKLSDKLQRLNNPVTETKLAGSTANADKLIPLCFGECHNVEPLLVDPATHEYQVHNGPIEDIIEVRDNGVPVSVTKFLTTGKFRLASTPAGVVTCSVQGDKVSGVYANDVVTAIKRIATAFGNATTRFVSGDLDNTSLNAFQTANTQAIGVYLAERVNVLEVCNKLADSLGARMVMSKTGLMSLVKIALPQGSSGNTITAANMADRSLYVGQTCPVKAAVQIGYCKNWKVQDTVALGVVENSADLFQREWLTATQTDSTAATNFNLFTEPAMEDTLLLVGANASTEALRRLNIWSTQRKILKYKGFGDLMVEKLGDPQTIQHARFGLSGGVIGQIVGITTDWLQQRAELEVLV